MVKVTLCLQHHGSVHYCQRNFFDGPWLGCFFDSALEWLEIFLGKNFFLIAGFWEAGNNFWRRNGLNFWLCMFKFAVAQIFFRIKGTEMVKSKRVGYETQGCPLERKKGIQFGTLSQKRKFSIFSYLGDKACRSWKGECFVSSFCFMKTTFYNCPKVSLKVWALKKYCARFHFKYELIRRRSVKKSLSCFCFAPYTFNLDWTVLQNRLRKIGSVAHCDAALTRNKLFPSLSWFLNPIPIPIHRSRTWKGGRTRP